MSDDDRTQEHRTGGAVAASQAGADQPAEGTPMSPVSVTSPGIGLGTEPEAAAAAARDARASAPAAPEPAPASASSASTTSTSSSSNSSSTSSSSSASGGSADPFADLPYGDRPELQAGIAFAGGFLIAKVLGLLGS